MVLMQTWALTKIEFCFSVCGLPRGRAVHNSEFLDLTDDKVLSRVVTAVVRCVPSKL